MRTLVELTTPDGRSLRLTPLGLATGGKLSPEDAADFQQRSIAAADLVELVPDTTRDSFERLRLLHSYGVLCYDAFTVADDLSWVVLEQALRERLIDFYGSAIPVIYRKGSETTFVASDFEAISDAFRPGGSHAKGWQLKPRAGTTPIRMPLTLRPLLQWARLEELLHGQHNRKVEEELFDKARNRFAHGAGYHLGTPVESSRAICDLAEIINRLWGQSTPGGHLYPSPLQRDVLVVGWSSGWAEGETGSSVAVMRAEQLAAHADDTHGWTYIVVRGVWDRDQLSRFDARYELTTYPVDLLWGPASRSEALAWLEGTAPTSDEAAYLDRLFAIRRDDGKVFLPCRADLLLGLPDERRGGTWHVVRADFPNDAFAHVRHIDAGESCRSEGQRSGGCPVDDVAAGSWSDAASAVQSLCPDLQPAKYADTRVPQPWPFPDSVGY